MRNLAVLGGQWGDEGKGKIIDLLSSCFSIVARFQGGHNAGHTVEVRDKRYALHLVPSGIIRKGRFCVIGNGVVVDPEALVAEIKMLSGEGIECSSRLMVSNRSQVILPMHREFDRVKERERGARKLGTTLRGIGPAYMSKSARFGMRMADLVDGRARKESLDSMLAFWDLLLTRGYGSPPTDGKALRAKLSRLAGKLRPYIGDTGAFLRKAIRDGRAILFEGAQGAMLDVDHGTYPFVTSSNTVAGGIAPGLGIPPKAVTGTIGVLKAYSTRVGSGPFPTEDHGEGGERLRRRGREYGTTTGRPRRCGWFDAVAARYSTSLSGFDGVALTLFDVLDGFHRIPVAVGYRYKGSLLKEYPADASVLGRVEPVYETYTGWNRETRGVTNVRRLPVLARDYIKRIEELIEVPVLLVSTGPARRDCLVRRAPLLRRLLPEGSRLPIRS